MRFRSPAIVAVSLFAALLSLVPATGCGQKKRKPPTIAELLDRARSAGSDEAQAKELTRVARLQFRSGNKSGASKTLSEARSKLSPSKPRKPKPAPAAEEAAPAAAADGEPKPDGEPSPRGSPRLRAPRRPTPQRRPTPLQPPTEKPQPRATPSPRPSPQQSRRPRRPFPKSRRG